MLNVFNAQHLLHENLENTSGIQNKFQILNHLSGLFSGKVGEGGMSPNKGVLRSLYLRSNSSSLVLSGALRLLYQRSNSSSLLSFHGITKITVLLRLLYLRRNSSPPSSLSSSSLSSKLMLLLLLLTSSSSLLSFFFKLI